MTTSDNRPRVAALVGPYLSGKTSLLEEILRQCEVIDRKGSVKDGNMVGDGSPEARARQMSTEMNIVSAPYLGDPWTFIDCPGSIDMLQDAHNALMIADAAVVVCEPGQARALTAAPILKFLDQHQIPHLIFINKMDTAEASVAETLDALQGLSDSPLVLREIPLRDGGDDVTGHVDLVSERAFRWQEGKPSELMELPESIRDRETAARTGLLESLADFDDALLEKLLEDVVPGTDEVFEHLTKVLRDGKVVPVFFGSAEHGNGVRRLLKALRHEAPGPQATAARLGEPTSGETAARVFKTVHAGHAGKLSFARVWSGEIADGMASSQGRVSGLSRAFGQKTEKVAKAGVGEVVALGRMDAVKTGDLVSASGKVTGMAWPGPLTPLFSMAVHAANRGDEVKMSGALAKIIEEDPSISHEHNPDTGEMLLWGQGEMHLLITLDKMKGKFHIDVDSERPQVPYKETIRKPTSQHARHKKQSGGHGEFGDVHLDIKPLARGDGFTFGDTITGGVVPKQYIPAVEAGVREYLARGPLGFPVVDLSVTLTDGQYHNVDSSDMAFRKAAQQAMREGMPNCQPVLLEPICKVVISMPSEFTSRMQRLVSGRRGQIMGFDAKPGWAGWDEVQVQLPQSEMHDLVIELRSMTMGVGTFEWEFDHLQELMGKEADQVVALRAQAAQ
ncbi:elongation factor G [Thalassospiraceae bacterium LMO-SO8]|nr:elongation factor G [Alphaproteobacteria bacterium LMO-S08]WND74327.1 elongation factor G [Thalassospiraceae bacterium LMO-SO8]